MKQRGRKAAVAIATDQGITSHERPDCPVDLTPEQRLEWLSVVNACPADWFPPETHRLLTQYCKHVVTSKHIASLIEDAEAGEDFNLAEYEKLLKLQVAESRVIMSLATKMRLTQQSFYSPEKTKGSSKGGVKPTWEK